MLACGLRFIIVPAFYVFCSSTKRVNLKETYCYKKFGQPCAAERKSKFYLAPESLIGRTIQSFGSLIALLVIPSTNSFAT